MKEVKFLIMYLGILVMTTYSLNAQTFEEQMMLQNLYSRGLNASRGAETLHRPEVTKANIKEVLQRFSKAGILIYTHVSDTLSVTLIDREGVILTKKVSISEEDLVNQVNNVNEYISGSFSLNAIANRGSVVVSENKNDALLKKAYENLNTILLPFKDDIKKLNHLIIVPSFNIATLPFAAFKFSEQTYLIDLMSYSISPSLYEVAASYDINNSHGNFLYDFEKSLFVSNPDFNRLKTNSFSILPGTTEETSYITRSLNKNSFYLLEGKNATKSNILKNIEDYDLLYFATHGVASSEDALDKSFLVFSGDSESDSYLTAREIQDIKLKWWRKLKAKLVVLSACQTGLGKVHEGGIIGLARAFQIAGAQNVLMSLWSVNDKETASLMRMFFDELKKGGKMLPHGALRNAILKFKELNNDPKYWASFSMFGIPNVEFDSFHQKLNAYSEDIIYQNINLKENGNKFDFKLLPVAYDSDTKTVGTTKPEDTYYKSGFFKVNDDDYVILQVSNKSDIPLYFTIIEINSEGERYPFMPNGSCDLSIEERKIAPGETKMFKDCVFSFSPPYERYLLKGIATSTPFNIQTYDGKPTTNKIDWYTFEFVYEIMEH